MLNIFSAHGLKLSAQLCSFSTVCLQGSPRPFVSRHPAVSSASSSLRPTLLYVLFLHLSISFLLPLLGLLLDCSNLSLLLLTAAVPPLEPSQSALSGAIHKTCGVPQTYPVIPDPVRSGHFQRESRHQGVCCLQIRL